MNSSLAAALRTRVLLPMETTNNPDKVKEWLNHVVFDGGGGGDANVDAADICRIISRLDRRWVTSHDAAPSNPSISSSQPAMAQRFKVEVSDGGARGRHWVATEDISPGQLVWVEHRPLVG